MRTVTATRYVAPLREGGSLPALVEADDDGMYVVKLRGAGQGPRALVAELVAGELARALGLAVPEIVHVDLDPRIALAEPDPEIQELLERSAGPNVGLDFLPGSLAHTPLNPVDPTVAADVVWFDALVMNVDRTANNPNLLHWHNRLWLIDHGAAFYRHHSSDEPTWRAEAVATDPFRQISQHVLLPFAGPMDETDARLTPLVTEDLLGELRALVPPEWADPDAYVDFIRTRLAEPRIFAVEAARAAG